MSDNFAAQVENWVRDSEVLLESIFKESTQRVFEIMTTTRGHGGNLPIDTGYLRASVQASNVAPPPINPKGAGNPGQKYTFNSGPVNLVISNAKLGGTTFVTFTANYSALVNYGTSKQPAALFVEQAAQRWPQIVGQVQAELKGRMGG